MQDKHKYSLNIHPADMITIKPQIRKKGKRLEGQITLPVNLIRRHNIENKKEIVLAFICKIKEEDEN